MNKFLTSESKIDFDRDGFVCVRQFVDEGGMRELGVRISDFIQEKVPDLPREVVFFDDLSDSQSLKQIQKLFEFDDYFCRMMFSSDFERLASHLLNAEVKGINMQYFNKPPGSSQPTPPHQDGYYFMLDPNEAVTMWLAIDPTDEENGCVRYIPGSHLHGLREHKTTDTLGFSQGIGNYTKSDIESEVCLELQPGDLLVHHALTIHRADRNESATRTRRAIGLIYYSTEAVESPDKQAKQELLMQRLAKQGKI